VVSNYARYLGRSLCASNTSSPVTPQLTFSTTVTGCLDLAQHYRRRPSSIFKYPPRPNPISGPLFTSGTVLGSSSIQCSQCASAPVMDPDHRPAHSCKHCQRIVLPYEKFVGDNHTVKLPHSGPEIRSAVEDGCELFRLFFARGTNTCFEGRSALSEFVTSKIGRPRRFRTICWKIAKFRALRKAQKWDGSFYIDIVTVKYDTLPSWGWALAFRYQQWTNYWTPTILKASPGECTVMH
jgi:hypothetical protein